MGNSLLLPIAGKGDISMSDFFSHPVPAVVILLGLLVFVHEFGHFIVGRLSGIAVEVFSIGFGPKLFGFSRNGTEYRISILPLGGFVKFAGSHPAEQMPQGLVGKPFLSAPLYQRVLTVAAGPVANFLLAVVVYAILGFEGVSHPPARIGEVMPKSSAERAGLQFDDLVTEIDGKKIKTWRDLESVISKSPGKDLSVTLIRQGKAEKLSLVPAETKTKDLLGRDVVVGRAGVALVRQPAVIAVTGRETWGFKMGLESGDQVLNVSLDADPAYKIGYYPELQQALSQGGKDVTLKVLRPSKNEELTLSGFVPERPLGVSAREFMSYLGLQEAALLVSEATEGANGVLLPGDLISKINGTLIPDLFALREVLLATTSAPARISVWRNHLEVELPIQLSPLEAQRPDGPVTYFMLPVKFVGQPIEPEPVMEVYKNPILALGFGVRQTTQQTLELTDNIKNLILGDIPMKALGGPMLIAKVAGDSAKHGWQTFLASMAMISINLGLLNLFPIPVLDGGQLLMMGAEGVRRKPLPEAAIENFQRLGFAIVMALVILATYNDFSRFWRSMLETVTGIIQ